LPLSIPRLSLLHEQYPRQSIISSVVIYIGFAVGLLNTYFFTKEGYFHKNEYGLTTVFIAIAVLMNGLTTLGMPAYITKFYPYYKDNLRPNKMIC